MEDKAIKTIARFFISFIITFFVMITISWPLYSFITWNWNWASDGMMVRLSLVIAFIIGIFRIFE